MQEKEAEAERQRDIKSSLHFTRADGLRLKANLLVGMLIFLGIALWMFTCAQILERSIKFGFALAGMLFLTVSVLGAGIIELVM